MCILWQPLVFTLYSVQTHRITTAASILTSYTHTHTHTRTHTHTHTHTHIRTHACTHTHTHTHTVAERKTSLGKDWHSFCLRCTKCKKTLIPGQHSEVGTHTHTLVYADDSLYLSQWVYVHTLCTVCVCVHWLSSVNVLLSVCLCVCLRQ